MSVSRCGACSSRVPAPACLPPFVTREVLASHMQVPLDSTPLFACRPTSAPWPPRRSNRWTSASGIQGIERADILLRPTARLVIASFAACHRWAEMPARWRRCATRIRQRIPLPHISERLALGDQNALTRSCDVQMGSRALGLRKRCCSATKLKPELCRANLSEWDSCLIWDTNNTFDEQPIG